MLTYEDCVAMSDLTEDEIDAIAEHESVPPIVALEIGRFIMSSANGQQTLQRLIGDDIRRARSHRDARREFGLTDALRHVRLRNEARAV